MIVNGSAKLSGLERVALRIATILVRAAITVQIWKFQSASRGRERVATAAGAMLGLTASALGLLLWAVKFCALAAGKPRTASHGHPAEESLDLRIPMVRKEAA